MRGTTCFFRNDLERFLYAEAYKVGDEVGEGVRNGVRDGERAAGHGGLGGRLFFARLGKI